MSNDRTPDAESPGANRKQGRKRRRWSKDADNDPTKDHEDDGYWRDLLNQVDRGELEVAE